MPQSRDAVELETQYRKKAEQYPELLKFWDTVREGQKPFGVLLRELRGRAELSQIEVSRRMGKLVTSNFINMVESGGRNMPLDKLADLADALGVNRAGLTRHWMFAHFPDNYRDIYPAAGRPKMSDLYEGAQETTDSETGDKVRVFETQASLTSDEFQFLRQFARLPANSKFLIRSLVNEIDQTRRSQIRISNPEKKWDTERLKALDGEDRSALDEG